MRVSPMEMSQRVFGGEDSDMDMDISDDDT